MLPNENHTVTLSPTRNERTCPIWEHHRKQYNRQTLGLVLVITATNILYFGSIVSMFWGTLMQLLRSEYVYHLCWLKLFLELYCCIDQSSYWGSRAKKRTLDYSIESQSQHWGTQWSLNPVLKVREASLFTHTAQSSALNSSFHDHSFPTVKGTREICYQSWTMYILYFYTLCWF